MADVIVVGAGPAGAAAAKRCAEKRSGNPASGGRENCADKVCDGHDYGPGGQETHSNRNTVISLIRVLTNRSASGLTPCTCGHGSVQRGQPTWLTWRRNLDYWMTGQAQAKGVQLWSESRVIRLKQKGKGFAVIVEKGGTQQELTAPFIVGADGATSRVRSFLFPAYKAAYVQIMRSGIAVSWTLTRPTFTGSTRSNLARRCFATTIKTNCSRSTTAAEWASCPSLSLTPGTIWQNTTALTSTGSPCLRSGCVQPWMVRDLIDHTFRACQRERPDWQGKAGGFVLPVSGERHRCCHENRSGRRRVAVVAALQVGRARREQTYLSEVQEHAIRCV